MATKNSPGAFNCYEKAKADEPIFVLLGRDATAPLVVLVWCLLREKMGLNDADQLREARDCAVAMQRYALRLGKSSLLTRAKYQACALLVEAASNVITDAVTLHVEEALDGAISADDTIPPASGPAASAG